MSSDRVSEQSGTIQLEIEPIETEGLGESQRRLAKEGIQPEGSRALIDDGHDRIAKDQGDKSVGPLGLVLDVYGWVEFKLPVRPRSETFGNRIRGPDEEDHGQWGEEIDEDGDPNRNQAPRVRDVYTPNPEGRGDENGDHPSDGRSPDHWDEKHDEE